jgi:hypothetical protein
MQCGTGYARATQILRHPKTRPQSRLSLRESSGTTLLSRSERRLFKQSTAVSKARLRSTNLKTTPGGSPSWNVVS